MVRTILGSSKVLVVKALIAQVGFDSRLLALRIHQLLEHGKPSVFTYWGLFVAYACECKGFAILKIGKILGVQ
jgi:hypothetical protein